MAIEVYRLETNVHDNRGESWTFASVNEAFLNFKYFITCGTLLTHKRYVRLFKNDELIAFFDLGRSISEVEDNGLTQGTTKIEI